MEFWNQQFVAGDNRLSMDVAVLCSRLFHFLRVFLLFPPPFLISFLLLLLLLLLFSTEYRSIAAVRVSTTDASLCYSIGSNTRRQVRCREHQQKWKMSNNNNNSSNNNNNNNNKRSAFLPLGTEENETTRNARVVTGPSVRALRNCFLFTFRFQFHFSSLFSHIIIIIIIIFWFHDSRSATCFHLVKFR